MRNASVTEIPSCLNRFRGWLGLRVNQATIRVCCERSKSTGEFFMAGRGATAAGGGDGRRYIGSQVSLAMTPPEMAGFYSAKRLFSPQITALENVIYRC